MFGPRMRNPRRRGFTSARLEAERSVKEVRARAYQAPEREHTSTTNRSADDEAPRVPPAWCLPGKRWAGHHCRFKPILGTGSASVPGAGTG